MTHNIAWFNVLPWLLLEPVIGGNTAYNLALLLNLTLCGLAAFLLTYQLIADARIAFLAGLVYQAWPFRLSQLDHPNLLATQWIPLFLLFLIFTIRRGRWRDACLAGIFFALIGYTRWQQLIPATLMGLTYFAGTFPLWAPRERRFVLSRLIFAGGISVLLLTPAGMLLNAQQADESMMASVLREGEETVMQTDVLAYITPAASHPLLTPITTALYDHYYADRYSARRFPAYLGLLPFICACLGVWYKRRDALPWLLMAALIIMLALGPVLRINGRFYPQIPTVYRLLEPLTIFRLMRVPDRYNMFLALPTAILAAYGLSGLFVQRQMQTSWRKWAASSLIASIIVFEYIATPIPQLPGTVRSQFFATLNAEAGETAIINLPFDPLRAKVYMFDQTFHRHPIIQGNVSRLPDAAYTYIDSIPWLKSLHYVNEFPPELNDVSRQLNKLAQEQISYIVIHKNLVGTDRINHWQRFLLQMPHYEDDQIVVYSTTSKPAENLQLRLEMVPGLGPVDVVVSNNCLTPGLPLEIDVGWGTITAQRQAFDVVVALVDGAGIAQQVEQFPLFPSWTSETWPAATLVWGYYPLQLSPSLPDGEYTLTLTLMDTETGQNQGASWSQNVTVQSDICNLTMELEATEANTIFGNRLRLVAYRVRQEGSNVRFWLYWRAEQRMDVDYTVFIHVFDPATGIPVAQEDAMPRRGAYPTSFWWPGEVVDDQIEIALHDVESGSYGIAIGIYDAATGERLPVMTNKGEMVMDRRLVLSELVTR